MKANLKRLTPADTALLATLTGAKRESVLIRLFVAQGIAAAPTGTKNNVMATLSEQLGCGISQVQRFSTAFRKLGLAGLIPRTNQLSRITNTSSQK